MPGYFGFNYLFWLIYLYFGRMRVFCLLSFRLPEAFYAGSANTTVFSRDEERVRLLAEGISFHLTPLLV